MSLPTFTVKTDDPEVKKFIRDEFADNENIETESMNGDWMKIEVYPGIDPDKKEDLMRVL
jgi:hypothetical protein